MEAQLFVFDFKLYRTFGPGYFTAASKPYKFFFGIKGASMKKHFKTLDFAKTSKRLRCYANGFKGSDPMS